MWLLMCVGHFIDNVAADSMTHWDQTLLFKVRKLFARLFYDGKKISAKKGRYRGADLDMMLSKLNPEIETAVKEVSSIIKDKKPFRACVPDSGVQKIPDGQGFAR